MLGAGNTTKQRGRLFGVRLRVRDMMGWRAIITVWVSCVLPSHLKTIRYLLGTFLIFAPADSFDRGKGTVPVVTGSQPGIKQGTLDGNTLATQDTCSETATLVSRKEAEKYRRQHWLFASGRDGKRQRYVASGSDGRQPFPLSRGFFHDYLSARLSRRHIPNREEHKITRWYCNPPGMITLGCEETQGA